MSSLSPWLWQSVVALQLPVTKRTKALGYGACFGSSCYPGPNRDPWSRHTTSDQQGIIRQLNDVIHDVCFGHFEWTSLQVNQDTQSIDHVDSNNMGLSCIIGGGRYTGGEFYLKILDQNFSANINGVAWLCDGTIVHGHEKFVGHRCSIVAFTHSSWLRTCVEDRLRLEHLGFRCPSGKSVMSAVYLLVRLPALPFRVRSYGEAVTYECFRRTSYRGHDLRMGLDGCENPAKWLVSETPPQLWSWKTVLSFAQRGAHINELELRSALAAIKWACRRVNFSRKINILLLDSQVSITALSKGRSSSRFLNSLVRRINSLRMFSSRHFVFAVVRSASNPADAPSRRPRVLGKRLKLRKDGNKNKSS